MKRLLLPIIVAMSLGMSGPVYPAAAGFKSLGGTPSGNIALDFVRSALSFSGVFDPRNSYRARADFSRYSPIDFHTPKRRPRTNLSSQEASRILREITDAQMRSNGVSKASYEAAKKRAIAKALRN